MKESPLAAPDVMPPIEQHAALSVEVIDYRAFSKNTLAGFLDLSLPLAGITVLGCTLHRHCGNAWVSLPAVRHVENGAVRYTPVLSFADAAARDAFQVAAIIAVNEHLRLRGGTPNHAGAVGGGR
ncbi:MAG TPA: hypothetical protein VN442_25775 [Bryobacteraceae bacterium]|nr:hypothetical protein [Bryobacteraceae bacterium]